jgi:hypothetical protein
MRTFLVILVVLFIGFVAFDALQSPHGSDVPPTTHTTSTPEPNRIGETFVTTRFHEKGGKEHEMPAHHEIEETIDEYLSKVSIDDIQPLFQSVNKAGTALSGRGLNRHNAWVAIRKRARNAGFLTPVGCHT